MSRIFKYELKRLIINKFFFGLIILSVFYSHEIMCNDIILGVANTAPFSGWSYGEYLAKVLPILLITLLFSISSLYSKHEESVQVLSKATPINQFKFKMLRYGAIIIAFVLISAVSIVYSLYFYAANFHYTNFGNLVFPALITLLPTMLFVFGLGVIGGRYHQGLIFVLIAAVLLINYVPMPYAVDLFGGNFFEKYPASLDIVEPVFSVPADVLIGKFIYGAAGITLMLIAGMGKKFDNNKKKLGC